MNNYEREELERLRREKRYQCPNCGALGRFKITEFPDYRYSRCGEYTVKCCNCGHFYGVPDDCSG